MAEPRTERYCPKCGEVTHSLICRNDGFATTVRGVAAVAVEPGQRMGELFAGRYRLEQLEKTSPLGTSYRALDERTRAPVHVHLLPAGLFADLSLVARFQREAPLIAALEHPNLLKLLDHGLAPDGTLYLSHELALGPTLAELVEREGPLDPRRVAAIGLSMLEALDEVHDHGLLHRSLGLHNIVLQRVGSEEVVKIAHTGLAKILCDDDAQPFVWPPSLVAAWRTMAPEQARGRGVTGHADLYSVGAILYELLTGKPVFAEAAPSDLLVAHSVKVPKPPERDGRTLVGPLVDVILRCLEKKPWNRPDGVPRAHELLEAALHQPLFSSPISTAEFGAPAATQPASRKTAVVAPRTGAVPTPRAAPAPPPATPTAAPTREEPRPAGARPATRPAARDTNPYGLPPAPPPTRAPIAYPGREQTRAVDDPPSAKSRRVTDPNPSGPLKALAPAPVSPRTGPQARLDTVIRPPVERETARALSSIADVADTSSDDDLVIRGGPSPAVAFLIGLVVAGVLGVVGYFLLFGGPSEPELGGADAAPGDAIVLAAGADTSSAPSAGTTSDAASMTEDAGDAAASADGASPADTLAAGDATTAPSDVGVVPTDAAQALDTRAEVPDTTSVATAPDTLGPAARPERPGPGPTKPDKPKPEQPTLEKPRPTRPTTPTGPIDPLADLEDPDFVNRPEPPSLRKALVDSEPAGAKVAVNGQIIGETPLYVEWQEGGSVDVVVSKVGYTPVRTRLSSGVGRAVRLKLEPAE